jgi:hypothetical protein
LIITPTASAQNEDAASAQNEDALTVADLKVNNVESNQTGDTLELNRTIWVEVEKLPEWIQESNDPSKLILYIDGNVFRDLTPALVENNTTLQFDLKHTSDNKDAWSAVLSRKGETYFTREVPVTVGLENGGQVPSSITRTLIVVNSAWFWTFLVVFLAVLALFLWIAHKSDVIRDSGPQPQGTKNGRPNRKPFSLARTQMASWFFIVIISYVFIWIVTTDLSNLTASVLGLIGISAATGLGAAIVDSSKRSDQENQRRTLEEQKKSDEVEVNKLKSEISALESASSATPPPANLDEVKANLATKEGERAAKQKEIEQANQKIQELDAVLKPRVSKNFISDILSDDAGISFHRFQIFAWTIVLIVIFSAAVYSVLAMPDFDATLLALMGISSGTYIGFKLPQQQG